MADCPDLPFATALKIGVEAVDYTARPDGLIPALLDFGAYPKVGKHHDPHPPAATTVQWAKATKHAQDEKSMPFAALEVITALHTRTGPDTFRTLMLPIGVKALVWRESSKKWNGPLFVVDKQYEDAFLDC